LSIFHNFLSVGSVRNLLPSGMHTTPIVSLLCLAKHEIPKPAISIGQQKGLMVIF